MDPNDAFALARPPNFALNLRRLPRELVHNVLDDLPLVKVLQILSHKNQHLDGCVLSHKLYRLLFRSPTDIAILTDLFILHREISRFTGKAIASANSILSQDAASLHCRSRLDFNDLRYHLNDQILDSLPYAGTIDMAMLTAHAPTTFPKEDDLWIRWSWIKEAKLGLNAAKAKQLNMAADLMAEFPGKLTLKKPLDPFQGGPRSNLKHIENTLRMRAKKARCDGKLQRHPGHCSVGIDNIELVPYDRYLWLFLDTLEKYPPIEEDTNIEGKLKEISLAQNTTSLKKPNSTFRYPPEIAAGINTVLKGIMYIYTGSPLLVIPRVQWEGYNTSDSGEKKPIFYIEWRSHASSLPVELHRCGAGKIMPHDEREYEWLRAFVKVVTWMEDKFRYEKVQVDGGECQL